MRKLVSMPGADYTYTHSATDDCGGNWCNGCAPGCVTSTGSERKTPANEDRCFETRCDTYEHIPPTTGGARGAASKRVGKQSSLQVDRADYLLIEHLYTFAVSVVCPMWGGPSRGSRALPGTV